MRAVDGENPSPGKGRQIRHPQSHQRDRKEGHIPPSSALNSVRALSGQPNHTGEAIRFTHSADSNVSLTQKHSHTHIQK